jgi:2,3,4,5-tetrahydropyridine-2-carboxylate N-succinyltransferase
MHDDGTQRTNRRARGKSAGHLRGEDFKLFAVFKTALNRGEVRAAERAANGAWNANAWVKRGILAGFRMGALADMSPTDRSLQFFDKDTYPIRQFTGSNNVRLVPGGSSVRDGAYLAPGVVCMPPMYVNVGAYVDVGTMIDSHALGRLVRAGGTARASLGGGAGGRRARTRRRSSGRDRRRRARRRQLRRL